MAVLPLNVGEMTLIAVFLLIAHNLIQEGFIQGKIGNGGREGDPFRIVSAVITILVIAPFIRHSGQGVSDTCGDGDSSRPPGMTAMIIQWGG
jgi:hypothetical protein